jgi:hypothetical protein
VVPQLLAGVPEVPAPPPPTSPAVTVVVSAGSVVAAVTMNLFSVTAI